METEREPDPELLQKSRAFGAVFGAFIGDAAGSRAEFMTMEQIE